MKKKLEMHMFLFIRDIKKVLLFMKLTIFLIIISLFNVTANNTYSQSERLSIDMENAEVRDVFKAIEEKTEYSVFYKQDQVDTKSKVTIKAKNKPVSDILDETLSGQDVEYTMVGKNIVITNQQEAIKISGKVTDSETKQTIPGVSVIEKGTTNGTTTSIDGDYEIIVQPNAVLVFSFIGMRTQEVPVGASTVIDIVMNQELIGIDEVVVTALGIKREVKALGYAAQNVNTSNIDKVTNTDFINSISGKVSGVQITSSGGYAGAGTYMLIRGPKSLTGNNQPMYVIDGVPMITYGGETSGAGPGASNRSIDINPSDIASMTVLKGGAATALYGVRASNGVVMITTKQGDKDQTNIEFSTSFTFDNVSQLPEVQKKYAQGSNGVWAGTDRNSFGPLISSLVYQPDATWPYDPNGILVPATNYPGGTPARAYDNYGIFETGFTNNTNLSISSGNENSRYYFSFGNLTQDGISPGSNFDRTSIRLNAEKELNKKLKTSVNVAYSGSNGNYIDQGNTWGSLMFLLRTPPTFDNSAGYILPDGTQRNWRGGGGYDNPYWTVNMNGKTEYVNRLMSNFSFTYKPWEWLDISYKLGKDWFSSTSDFHRAIHSGYNPSGYLYERQETGEYLNSDLILTARKQLNEDMNLVIMAGNNLFEEKYRGLTSEGYDFVIPQFNDLSNCGSVTSYKSENYLRTASFFGEISFDYKRMLYMGITGRNEWASSMPKNNLSAFYPAANASFILTQLKPLQDNKVLSFAKIRASYAKTANYAEPFNTKDYYTTAYAGDGWTTGVSFPYNSLVGYSKDASRGSSELTHETTISTEIGLDLKFFMNRAGLDFSYFVDKSKDLLLSVPVASSSGYEMYYMNAGSMENKGFEIALTGTPVKTNNFSWDIMVNFSKYTNKVTALAEGIQNVDLGGLDMGWPTVRAVLGQEYQTIFAPDCVRDPATGKPIINDDPTSDYYGSYFVDETGDKAIGTVLPDWTSNISNTFRFKNLSLTVLLDIKQGGQMYNGTRGVMNVFGTSKDSENRETTTVLNGINGHLDANGDLVVTGTENNIPLSLDQSWYQGQGGLFSGSIHQFIEETSWVRLREVILSYSLSKTQFDKLPVKGLNLYVSGKNLWMNTPYRGVDPETSLAGSHNAQGIDYFNFPGSKSFTVGFKVQF